MSASEAIKLSSRVVLKHGMFGYYVEVDGAPVGSDREGDPLRALAKALTPAVPGTTLHSGAVETKGTDDSWLKDGNWRRVGVQ